MIAAWSVQGWLAAAALGLIVALCFRRGIFGMALALCLLRRIGVLG